MHESTVSGAPAEVERSLADLPELHDPEPDRSLDDDPLADRAEREAARDVLTAGEDLAGGIDAAPGAAGAAASASGRDDVGPI